MPDLRKTRKRLWAAMCLLEIPRKLIIAVRNIYGNNMLVLRLQGCSTLPSLGVLEYFIL